jgi:hypothetical protein
VHPTAHRTASSAGGDGAVIVVADVRMTNLTPRRPEAPTVGVSWESPMTRLCTPRGRNNLFVDLARVAVKTLTRCSRRRERP